MVADRISGPRLPNVPRDLESLLGLPAPLDAVVRRQVVQPGDDFGRTALRRAPTAPRGDLPVVEPARAAALRDEATVRRVAAPTADARRAASAASTRRPAPPSSGGATPPAGLTVGDTGRAVKRAEQMLKRAGFDPGKVDGRFDARTARAVERFQAAVGRSDTGVLDDVTRDRLGGVDERIREHDGKLLGPGQKNRRTLEAERRLDRLGYDVGKVDGVYDRDTGRAMQAFRRDQGKKAGSLLMGKPTERELRDESAALSHDPRRARVKASAERRRADRQVAAAATKRHADGTVGLGEGSPRSKVVKTVQQHLKAAGYDPQRTDGRFDERTRGALEAFQRRSGLPETGRVDGRTWNKLKNATMESKGAFDPTQREGERSDAVRASEKLLKKLGYNPGKVDGLYTEATQRAVDEFRKKKHLGSIGGGISERVHDAMVKALKAKQNRIPTRHDTGYSNGSPFPVKLGKVDGEWTGYRTALAYRRMERAARKDGIDLDIVSGFRTMAEQRRLYDLYGPGRAARPGYSNHQNGRALDLNVQTAPGQMSVGVGPVYNWLARNASKYGFQRIDLEAWHWEYKR